MPDNVLTNILDRLPLQDAARTAILARNWRFKWTMLISQLVFDEDFFEYLRKTKAENDNQVRVISRILFQLRGAITKFFLYVDDDLDVEDEDVIHWISFLFGKGMTGLTVINCHFTPLKLPTRLFSCLELKHLKLFNCCFNRPPTFHGFPNLLSLDLGGEIKEIGEFITRCPLLEILKMDCIRYETTVKVDEIAKLENLKILSLSVYHLETVMNFSSSGTIFELLGSLPKLQELELKFDAFNLLEGVANKRFSTGFPSLKALKLSIIWLDDGMKLSCAFELIRSCPNLQTLEITTSRWHAGHAPQVDYDTTGQLQLRSVKFEYLKGSESELCLLKYLLACSPFLKNIVIHPSRIFLQDEMLKFASKLLKLHRASPVVDIDLS
ncbi:F-box/FBD/LRR-repeat protein At1g13570-like [Bidens hawaiensis]|uniref:F-box/FBD/LRR-repeat protein At1g13570-like n=1 Tax=Bidens hawaiensis TaxID=980011 RepID=UPI004049996E